MKIDSGKLARIQALCPTLRPDAVEDYVCADWPEGEEHQAWLDSASAEEIAAWVSEGLSNCEEAMVD